jgi:hypothetical protein
MIREYNRMKLINNILYRITTIEDEERQQLVLPAAARLSTYDFGTMESQMAWTDSLVFVHPSESCTAGRRLSASAS